MKLSRRSTLRQVAAAVAGALHKAGISAVLTGGACATIYSEGAYQSEDLDLILLSSPPQKALDQATDSCRDRLAAFYHWRDRQGLQAAVAIAARHDVDLERIRTWSEKEAESTNFEEFRRELRIARASRRRHRGVRRARRNR